MDTFIDLSKYLNSVSLQEVIVMLLIISFIAVIVVKVLDILVYFLKKTRR